MSPDILGPDTFKFAKAHQADLIAKARTNRLLNEAMGDKGFRQTITDMGMLVGPVLTGFASLAADALPAAVDEPSLLSRAAVNAAYGAFGAYLLNGTYRLLRHRRQLMEQAWENHVPERQASRRMDRIGAIVAGAGLAFTATLIPKFIDIMW